MPHPDRAELLRLIDAAVKAPSADNLHHFRFVDTGDGLDIEVDDFFVSCDEPHRRLLTLIAYGAAVENLRLRLTETGRTFEPRWFPGGKDQRTLLRIRWLDLDSTPTADPLARRIETRHTNRRLFRGPPLDGATLHALEAAVASVGSASVAWFDDGPRRRGLLNLMRIAESARFRSAELHAELFEAVDFAAGWRHTVVERLPPASLEVEPFLRGGFALMRRPGVMRVARGFGAHHMLGLRAGWLPAWTAPHLGSLSSSLPPDEAALAVGAAFQRLWLAADEAGVALQPMVASSILAWQGPTNDPVRAALKRRLTDGWQRWSGDALPMIVFRLGRAVRPRVVAGTPTGRALSPYVRLTAVVAHGRRTSTKRIAAVSVEPEEEAHVVEVGTIATR